MLELTEISEILALEEALLHARFYQHTHQMKDIGSPAMAKLAKKISIVLDELVRNGDVPDIYKDRSFWKSFEDLKFQNEVVRRTICQTSAWKNMENLRKKEYVEILTMPFGVKNHTIERLVRFGDSYHNKLGLWIRTRLKNIAKDSGENFSITSLGELVVYTKELKETDCIIYPIEGHNLSYGQEMEAKVFVVSPQHMKGAIKNGEEFQIKYSGQIIGEGVILETNVSEYCEETDLKTSP